MGNQYHCCCIVTYGIKSTNKRTVREQFSCFVMLKIYSFFTAIPEQLQVL